MTVNLKVCFGSTLHFIAQSNKIDSCIDLFFRYLAFYRGSYIRWIFVFISDNMVSFLVPNGRDVE